MARTNLTALYLTTLPLATNSKNQLATKLNDHDSGLDALESKGSISVLLHGAVADNATDNSTAIEAAIAAATASGRGVYFPRSGNGVYRFSRTINHPGSFLEIAADVGVELRFMGTGKILSVDAGAASGAIYGARLTNLFLVGNAGATIGVYLRGVLNSVISNVRVEDVTTAGLRQELGSLNVIDNFICSRNIRTFTTIPTYGIDITQRGVAKSSATRIVNPTIEGLYQTGGTGIRLDFADRCSVVGGTSEGNDVGIEITANGGQHRVESLWMEANATIDIKCAGWWTAFDGCLSTGLARFSAGAYGNTLRDGSYTTVTNQSTYAQRYDGCAIGGTLTDTATTGSARLYWSTPGAAWSGV